MWRHLRSYSGVPRLLAAPAAKANSGKHIAKALSADPTQAALFPLARLTWQPSHGPGNPSTDLATPSSEPEICEVIIPTGRPGNLRNFWFEV